MLSSKKCPCTGLYRPICAFTAALNTLFGQQAYTLIVYRPRPTYVIGNLGLFQTGKEHFEVKKINKICHVVLGPCLFY